jgi:hypothetical protein
MQAAHDAEVKRKESIVGLWIMTPIAFYGKVVDQDGVPVTGAKILMIALDHPLAPGSRYESQSDSNGLFSINGIHGAALQVHVSKEGYYPLPQSWGDFAYAARVGNQKAAHPDESDPAVFVLRKMGVTEPLIVQKKNINIGRTGTPIGIDLRTGKAYGVQNPDIQVQAWTQDQGITPGTYEHYNWRCVITVPGGGLQARIGGEFDFEAPTDGYQPSDEIDMSASDPDWSSNQSREYYLKLANGEYARISFVMATGGYNDFAIISYLNPTPGHRNLEYNPNQQTGE